MTRISGRTTSLAQSAATIVRLPVSSRPESERVATESWLARRGVKYVELIMWPINPEDRTEDAVSAWKARECATSGAEFYIESEPPLADAIRRLGVRVLCPGQRLLQ